MNQAESWIREVSAWFLEVYIWCQVVLSAWDSGYLLSFTHCHHLFLFCTFNHSESLSLQTFRCGTEIFISSQATLSPPNPSRLCIPFVPLMKTFHILKVNFPRNKQPHVPSDSSSLQPEAGIDSWMGFRRAGFRKVTLSVFIWQHWCESYFSLCVSVCAHLHVCFMPLETKLNAS